MQHVELRVCGSASKGDAQLLMSGAHPCASWHARVAPHCPLLPSPRRACPPLGSDGLALLLTLTSTIVCDPGPSRDSSTVVTLVAYVFRPVCVCAGWCRRLPAASGAPASSSGALGAGSGTFDVSASMCVRLPRCAPAPMSLHVDTTPFASACTHARCPSCAFRAPHASLPTLTPPRGSRACAAPAYARSHTFHAKDVV